MSWWPFSKSKNTSSDFVKEYLSKNEVTIPSIRTIGQLEFVVLDTETTGLDVKTDSVLSFGAVKIFNECILVKSAVEWYPESSKNLNQSPLIHGLVERSPQLPTSQFIRQVLTYLSNSIIVGHHVGFDLGMLQQMASPFGLSQFHNPVIDTMSFTIRLDHGPNANPNHIQTNNYSLEALCDRFQIPLDDRHTATGDALLTALLFLKLLKIAEAKGVNTYGQLIR
ncbi:3'-5' exonuclease [Algoriphagus sp. AGSA1]|uniref:3'-5' exonuclease n=1 Tax=Algoriphagus sp. AGSA1 TaxID=2907213 RepID=UPI001F36E4F0|nr:3'-5' exonuclease [Algoriphagus sp. AGSA1]MCE7055320.1 3'-5' exonuclease [Algoriphagus sp. AGSA1]